MTFTQIANNLEVAFLILGVAFGLARIGLSVWAYLDHGHPDARREWVQRAVQLATLTLGDAESLLKAPSGTAIDETVAKDIGSRAESYLADHGLSIKLDTDTIRLVLNELRDYPNHPMGYIASKS